MFMQKDSVIVESFMTPPYWDQACTHLMEKDRVMARLIPQIGSEVGLQTRGCAFETLARSMVGQQISVKAADSIWNKLLNVLQPITPEKILSCPVDALRAVGLSARKVDYMQDLALHFSQGSLRSDQWPQMDDEEIIGELIAIRGVGRWTAEMFLIFHMLRPNVLPLDDAGLLKGISHNYFSGEAVSRSVAREVADGWRPWCTVATWYIWRSLTLASAK